MQDPAQLGSVITPPTLAFLEEQQALCRFLRPCFIPLLRVQRLLEITKRLPIQPVREKGADHAGTDLEVADTAAHGYDLASTVGHRDTAFGWAPHAADHGKVMVIEGAGMQAVVGQNTS